MKSGMRVAFLLLLVTGTVTVKGSDPSDDPRDDDVHHEAAALRPKRGALGVFDFLRGKGASTRPPPAKPSAGGDGFGFNLADALRPNPKPSKPAGGNDSGFNLEDALRPAVKPSMDPSGGSCQGNLVEKLNQVIEKQNQQLRLLQQMTGSNRRMR